MPCCSVVCPTLYFVCNITWLSAAVPEWLFCQLLCLLCQPKYACSFCLSAYSACSVSLNACSLPECMFCLLSLPECLFCLLCQPKCLPSLPECLFCLICQLKYACSLPECLFCLLCQPKCLPSLPECIFCLICQLKYACSLPECLFCLLCQSKYVCSLWVPILPALSAYIRIRIRIRIYLLARRNLLWDILRLPSSRRAALGLYVILTLWRGRGANQPPYALLHRSSPRYALRHGRRHVNVCFLCLSAYSACSVSLNACSVCLLSLPECLFCLPKCLISLPAYLFCLLSLPECLFCVLCLSAKPLFCRSISFVWLESVFKHWWSTRSPRGPDSWFQSIPANSTE